MDQSNLFTNVRTDRRSVEGNDENLVELTNQIFDEITDKYKLNGKKLRKLLTKYGAICQSSSFQNMFKREVLREQTALSEDYRKLEAYQNVSEELDAQIFTTFKDIKLMEFNIGESRFVESFKMMSDNIKSTKEFLQVSKSRIDQIYDRIRNLTKCTVD